MTLSDLFKNFQNNQSIEKKDIFIQRLFLSSFVKFKTDEQLITTDITGLTQQLMRFRCVSNINIEMYNQ